MTVRQLLAAVDSRELSEWMAFYRLEPWGEDRADRRAALIASTIANVHRGKRKPFRVDDFMPKYDRPVQTWQQQLQIAKAIAAAWGD